MKTTDGSSSLESIEISKQNAPPKTPWCHDLAVNYDWWSCWIGFLWIIISTLVVWLADPKNSPEPGKWNAQPSDSFPSWTWCGMIAVLPFMVITSMIKDRVIRTQKDKYKPEEEESLLSRETSSNASYGTPADLSLNKNAHEPLKRKTTSKDPSNVPKWYYISSFVFSFCCALLAMFLGKQVFLNDYGFAYAFWSVFFGILVANILIACDGSKILDWMLICHKTGYFVKVALVLLGLRLQTVAALGGPGLIVSWVVTPLVLVFTYAVAVNFLGFGRTPEDRRGGRSIAMCLAAGLSICGPSAATAASDIVETTQHELALVLAIITVSVVIHIMVMPVVALATGLDHLIAGAWFGGSIDETGSVAAAAGNVSCTAEATAVTVKMIQNAQLGLLLIGIALFWTERSSSKKHKDKSKCAMMWKAFPKFIIGFVAASIYYSSLLDHTMSNADVNMVLSFAKAGNHWYFSMFFVGIGLKVDIRKMIKDVRESKILRLYLIGQSFDLALTLLASWFAFSGKFLARPFIECD